MANDNKKTPKRFLLTWGNDELEPQAIIQQVRGGYSSLASYIRALIIKDGEKDNSNISNEDIYNKLVDIKADINDFKKEIINK